MELEEFDRERYPKWRIESNGISMLTRYKSKSASIKEERANLRNFRLALRARNPESPTLQLINSLFIRWRLFDINPSYNIIIGLVKETANFFRGRRAIRNGMYTYIYTISMSYCFQSAIIYINTVNDMIMAIRRKASARTIDNYNFQNLRHLLKMFRELIVDRFDSRFTTEQILDLEAAIENTVDSLTGVKHYMQVVGSILGLLEDPIYSKFVSAKDARDIFSKYGDKQTCVICRDDITLDSDIGSLDCCDHVYCVQCFLDWSLTS